MLEIVINHSEANQKVFKFVKKYLNNAPLSLIYKIFRKKDVKVNGKRVNEDYILKEHSVSDWSNAFLGASGSQIEVFVKRKIMRISKIIYVVNSQMGVLCTPIVFLKHCF